MRVFCVPPNQNFLSLVFPSVFFFFLVCCFWSSSARKTAARSFSLLLQQKEDHNTLEIGGRAKDTHLTRSLDLNAHQEPLIKTDHHKQSLNPKPHSLTHTHTHTH